MAEELQIPPNVVSDSKACELIRAWAAHGGLVCSLNPGAWPQDQAPIAWGILLSDVARHVADALHQTYGLEKAAILTRMRGVFDSELDRPPAETQGKFI
ncbi:MAG: DUF5076 domain-containing protein [Terriglobales bacterium]